MQAERETPKRSDASPAGGSPRRVPSLRVFATPRGLSEPINTPGRPVVDDAVDPVVPGALLAGGVIGFSAFVVSLILGKSLLMSLAVYSGTGIAGFGALYLVWLGVQVTRARGWSMPFRSTGRPGFLPYVPPTPQGLPEDWRQQCVSRPGGIRSPSSDDPRNESRGG